MKILLVDDHPLFREGLVHVLASLATDVSVLEASDARSALVALEQHDDLDLLLIDLALPDAKPFDVLAAGRRLQPQVPAVVISATESRFEIDRAAALGAQGYVFKSTPGHALLAALRRVMEGELVFPDREPAESPTNALTARQLEVVHLLSRGLSNRDIATALELSENTVKVHLATIYRVLGVSSRTTALRRAQELGLLHDGP
ncbi:MAG: response regulator transcription factor [Archangium sp.]|nr:response regulator transcription factor [Archangium sp.]